MSQPPSVSSVGSHAAPFVVWVAVQLPAPASFGMTHSSPGAQVCVAEQGPPIAVVYVMQVFLTHTRPWPHVLRLAQDCPTVGVGAHVPHLSCGGVAQNPDAHCPAWLQALPAAP